MKLIIAGNYREATQYALEHKLNINEWMFASSEDRIRGLRGIEVIRTGEYWRNPIDKSEHLEHIRRLK